MRDYSGIMRSLMLSMLIVGCIVLIAVGAMWYRSIHADPSAAFQSVIEEVNTTLTKGGRP